MLSATFFNCEKREEDLSDKDVNVIGICLDCIGMIGYIKPFVSSHELNIEVFIDKNADLKRLMGINVLPYTILYDQNQNVICRYAGFCISSDEMIADKLTQCLNKMANSQ